MMSNDITIDHLLNIATKKIKIKNDTRPFVMTQCGQLLHGHETMINLCKYISDDGFLYLYLVLPF
jgi:hypothetical protein